jgi:hypothetical protein
VHCRPLDVVLLTVGRIVYGRAMDIDRLRERTAYMYIPPEQMMTPAIMRTLAPSLGLRLIAEHAVESTSVTQLKQRATVFVKEERPGA